MIFYLALWAQFAASSPALRPFALSEDHRHAIVKFGYHVVGKCVGIVERSEAAPRSQLHELLAP